MTQDRISHSALRMFTGDLLRYVHPINRQVIYTPGVRFLADAGEAYWLIDEIALTLGSSQMERAIAADVRVGELHFWHLAVAADQTAWLRARANAGVSSFIRKRIAFTDFPLDHVEIWAGFDGRYWTLYLPSEH